MKKKFFVLALTSLVINLNLGVYASNILNLVQITQSQIPLNSKMKKKYSGYKYTIQNVSSEDLNLVNAQIVNGNDGAAASSAVDDGNGVGTLWAIMGPLGLFTLGIGWAVGIIGTPIVWITSGGRNKKARNEGAVFSNIVDLGILPIGASTSVQTLVRIGSQPQLKVTLQDPSSKELIMVSK